MAGTLVPPPNRNSGYKLVGVTWVLLGISTFVIAGRQVSKQCILRHLGFDDLLMLLAWCNTAVYSATIQLSFHHGLGRHFEYLSLEQDLSALRWVYIGQGFCLGSLMLGRASCTLYLLSIMGRSRPILRICLLASLTANVGLNIALLGFIYGKCGTNMEVMINPLMTCYRPSALSRMAQFVGAANAAMDAVLTIAPVTLIVKLNTTARAKIGATILLGLSSVAMAAAVWRTVSISIIFSVDVDFTWNIVEYFLASSVEQNVIIITATIPTLGPIVKHLTRKWNSASSTCSKLAASTLRRSGESDEVYRNLAISLGMRFPHLGNSVTIVAGPQARDSQEHILPLHDITKITATVQTSVRVESNDDLLTAYHLR